MKNSEIISVIEQNEQRIVDALKTVDVTEESYMRLLNHIGMGRNIVNALRQQPNPFETEAQSGETSAAAHAEPEPPAPESEDTGKVISFPSPEERASDAENVEESSEAARADTPPAPEPEPELSYEEVRSRLARLVSAKSVDIPAIMQRMGYTKLSDIPAARYGELLAAAEGAV